MNRKEKILTIWSVRRITRLIIMASQRSLNQMAIPEKAPGSLCLTYDTTKEGDKKEKERAREAEGKYTKMT